MLTLRNPFIYDRSVPPSRFVGRKREIRVIFGRAEFGSVTLCGERLIGKTSLLHYVADPDIVKGWGITPDQYILIYLNCQAITGFTSTTFWQMVLYLLSRRLSATELGMRIEQLYHQKEIHYTDIDDVLYEIDKQGKKLILLLDEFEWAIRTYTDSEVVTARDFLSRLRALIDMYPALSLITATCDPLEVLCGPIEFIGSPFYNGFASVRLERFTREESEELIDQALKGTGIEFSEEDRAFVYKVSEGRPYWLQNACFKLFEGKTRTFSR